MFPQIPRPISTHPRVLPSVARSPLPSSVHESPGSPDFQTAAQPTLLASPSHTSTHDESLLPCPPLQQFLPLSLQVRASACTSPPQTLPAHRALPYSRDSLRSAPVPHLYFQPSPQLSFLPAAAHRAVPHPAQDPSPR